MPQATKSINTAHLVQLEDARQRAMRSQKKNVRNDIKRVRQPKKTWSLKKTLSRKVAFHPIEQDDLRFLWAAHRNGALDTVDEHFAIESLEPEEFDRDFIAIVTTKYHGVWILEAETKNGFVPIGMVLAFMAHPDERLAPFWVLDQMVWFPWSNPRNKIEALVNFLNDIRREISMIGFARLADKKLFEEAARHGVVRRIGTSQKNVFPDENACVFETRRP